MLHQLNSLLTVYRRKPLPPVPRGLESSVWRAIRLRAAERDPVGRFLEELLTGLEDVRLMTSALVAAVVIGILFSSLALSPVSTLKTSLGLDVFSRSTVSPLARLAATS